MARKITEHSYQYIQGWLKNKYATDPEFRRKINETNSICSLRKKLKNKTNILMLEELRDYYQHTHKI